MSVTPLSGKESKAFTVSWDTSAPAIACLNGANPMWNGVNHYEVHRISAASDPFATESYYDVANRVAVVGAGINTVNNFVHRSNARFYYRVYACEGAGSCASFYGDGTGLASESTYYRSDFDHTDFERYSLTGITGPDDGALGVVVDNDAIAAHAVFFPPSWGSGLSNKMMLYWGVSGNDVSPSHVYAMLHDVEGWPSGGFNGSGDWGAEHVVAKGSMTTTDDDYAVDHPWIVLSRDGADQRVEMMLQTQCDGDTGCSQQIIQMVTSDDEGLDFGIGCADTGCTGTPMDDADTRVAIEPGVTTGADHVAGALHSRVYWNYIENHYVDTSTMEPFMLYQLDLPDSGGTCEDTGNDDIGLATATWSTDHWEWTVEDETTAPYCPEVVINDGHDNTYVPLPDDEYRVYWKQYGTDQFFVSYWTPTGWAEWYDASGSPTSMEEVYFYWDGSTTDGPSPECMGDLAAITKVWGGTFHDGMFFQVLDQYVCPEVWLANHPEETTAPTDLVGFDNDASSVTKDGAIVFAELTN